MYYLWLCYVVWLLHVLLNGGQMSVRLIQILLLRYLHLVETVIQIRVGGNHSLPLLLLLILVFWYSGRVLIVVDEELSGDVVLERSGVACSHNMLTQYHVITQYHVLTQYQVPLKSENVMEFKLQCMVGIALFYSYVFQFYQVILFDVRVLQSASDFHQASLK